MQIVTSWMREGIEQGLQQGRQEGLERGIQLGSVCKLSEGEAFVRKIKV